jgi:WD40 repeat protein
MIVDNDLDNAPQAEITMATTASATGRTQVFMSYARANRAIVERLLADLTAHGIRVWIDRSGLEPGTDDWEQAIRDAIRDSWAVLFVASPDARRSRYVKDELRIANMYKCRVFPVWVAGEEIMDALPMGHGGTHTVDLRNEAYDSGLRTLISALVKGTGPLRPVSDEVAVSPDVPPLVDDTHIDEEAPAPPAAFEPRNPYKGLKAFTGDDVSDFFGRNRLVNELCEALREATSPSDNPRFLALLVGPSGSGKSSVVMAGLIPRLQNGALPGSENWIYLPPMVPGTHPLESLALSLASGLPGHSLTTLTGDLKDDAGRGLHLLARQIAGQPDRRVVLLVDQFEELFTLTVDEAERKRFIDLLVTAVMEPRGVLLAILTLRADFYDRPLNYPALGSLLETRSKAILPMDVEDLRDVIEKPAALGDVRLTFDDGLVGDLLFEVRGEPAALPLLQFTLDQLFQRREGLRLTRRAYQEIGGVKGALANHAEATYTNLRGEQHQRLARALFLRLIEPGATEQDTTRRRARLSELTLDDETQTEIYSSVAQAFIEARLLTTNKFGEHVTIEVSHEALIREWERLGGWLKDARDDVRLQKAIAQDTMEWLQRGRKSDDDGLYRGTLLIDAQDWAKRNVPSADEQAFLNAGAARQAELAAIEERRTQELLAAAERARWARRIAVVVGLIAAIISGAIFLTARSQADQAAIEVNAAKTAERSAKAAEKMAITAAANANATLSPAAKTQVAIAAQVSDNQRQNDALRWAARSRDLAQSKFHEDRTVAALLAIRAFQVKDSPEALAALDKALEGYYVPHLLTHGPSGVTSVAISPDGRYALTGSVDATIRLWDLRTGTQVRVFFGHTNSVMSVTFGPDGTNILSGSADTSVRLWDIATGKLVRIFTGHRDSVRIAAFSPDGKKILTGSTDNSARLWDVATGKGVSAPLIHSNDVTSGTFSPDGRYILTGSLDRIARLWDVATGQNLRIFTFATGVTGTSSVNDVAFSPDGRYVLTGNADGVARLWDVATGKILRNFRAAVVSGTTFAVTSVAFSPDGRYVVAGGSNNTARLWEVTTGAQVRVYPSQTPNTGSIINSLAFSPNGRYVLTGSSDSTVRLWDVVAGTEVVHLTTPAGAIGSVAFSPDGRYALTGGANNTARLWDMKTNMLVRAFTGQFDEPLSGVIRSITSVAFSPNGRYALTGSTDNTMRLWDVETGTELRTFTATQVGVSRMVNSVAFSPDGQFVLSGGTNSPARLWNVVTGKEVGVFIPPPGSPNINPLSTPTINSVAFSPDGRFVLTGSLDRTARLWDAANGQLVRNYVGHTNSVTSVAFSPDGRYILTGSLDGTVRLWEVGSGTTLRTFTGHESESNVNSVAFSPDGRYILTGGTDRTARLWDAETAQSLRTFRVYTAGTIKVAFSPDGRYALTGSTDTTARLWLVNYADVIAYVCSWLPRDFTPEERERYAIADSAATCPELASQGTATLVFPPTTTALATWTPFAATALPMLSPTLSPTSGPSPTRDLTRITTPTNTRTPTNTPTPSATLVLDLSQTAIASPTITRTNTPPATLTPDLSVFDFGDIQPENTADNSMRLKRPPRWTIRPQNVAGAYTLTAGPSNNPGATITIMLASPEAITRSSLGLLTTYNSPQATLDAYLQVLSPTAFRANPVTTAKIGTMEGYGVRLTSLPPREQFEYDIRLVALPDGRWLWVAASVRIDLWTRAQPALEAIIASIEVLPVPTPTVSPTVIMQATP